MRAVLPSLTQLWKKLGATETPIASLVMPVEACAALLAITRNVPKSKTRRCCVYLGSEANSLQIENEKRGKEIRNAIKKCNNNKLRMYVKRKSSKDQLIYAQRGEWRGGRAATIVTHVFLYLLQSALTHCLARAIKESHRACGTNWKTGKRECKRGRRVWEASEERGLRFG